MSQSAVTARTSGAQVHLRNLSKTFGSSAAVDDISLDVPAGAFVNAYLGLEDREQTFAWLEHAYQEQSNILQFLKVHPYFDPLRDDPRFKDLVHRVGLD